MNWQFNEKSRINLIWMCDHLLFMRVKKSRKDINITFFGSRAAFSNSWVYGGHWHWHCVRVRANFVQKKSVEQTKERWGANWQRPIHSHKHDDDDDGDGNDIVRICEYALANKKVKREEKPVLW